MRLLLWCQASEELATGRSHIWKGSGQVSLLFGWANRESFFLWGNVSPMVSRTKALIGAQFTLWSSPILFSILAAQESEVTAVIKWWEENCDGDWKQVWPQESGPWTLLPQWISPLKRKKKNKKRWPRYYGDLHFMCQKTGLRKVKQLTQGHSGNMWQN